MRMWSAKRKSRRSDHEQCDLLYAYLSQGAPKFLNRWVSGCLKRNCNLAHHPSEPAVQGAFVSAVVPVETYGMSGDFDRAVEFSQRQLFDQNIRQTLGHGGDQVRLRDDVGQGNVVMRNHGDVQAPAVGGDGAVDVFHRTHVAADHRACMLQLAVFF